MIIDIRGTHGSGKSFVMHRLLEMSNANPITGTAYGKSIQHLGYHLHKWNAVLLGKYKNICGGCDGIKTADEVCRRVRMFSEQFDHVLLEGILVAHTFKRYSDLAEELGDYHFMFLDTPLKVCIRRVWARRKAAGNTKPFNSKNLRKDWNSIWLGVRKKMTEQGQQVTVLPWEKPLPTVMKVLDEN